MKKITTTQKAIVEAHLKANETDTWDFPYYPYTISDIKTTEDLKRALEEGKTVQALHQEVIFHYCNTTANLLQGMFAHKSQSYVRDYTKGFKTVFQNLNIA